jgi:DNA polymerase-3 subunit delta
MASQDLTDLSLVHLIWGSERLLLDRAVDRLKARLAAVADLDFNLDVFDGEDSAADDIVAAANTLPFMSERRLVIVRHVERMSPSGQSIVAEYAEDPSPLTVLVLVASKVDKRTRLYKAVDKSGRVSEYKAPDRKEYPAHVIDLFAGRGVAVSWDAAAALVDTVGTDLAHLSSEVDKIVAYVGQDGVLGAEQVADVVARTAPVSPFALMDAIGARELEVSLRTGRILRDQGESPHRLLGMGVRHVRNLIAASSRAQRGENQATIGSALKLRDWQVRNILRQARHFETAELVGALGAASEAEAEMKTSPVDPGLVLERWIAAVCRATP